MNKIIVNKENYDFINQEIELINSYNSLVLNIKGNVLINDLNNNQDIKLIINMMDDSNLIYNRFNTDINKMNVEINVNNNDSVSFNQSIYQNNKGSYMINTNILGNNNHVTVNVYGVSHDKGSLTLDANGDIKKHIKDNEMLENVRILSLNDEINTIIPNLLVSSEEVMVNHNATISGVDKDYLFYLMSKGLSEVSSSKLIIAGFINHNLKLNPEDKLKIKF